MKRCLTYLLAIPLALLLANSAQASVDLANGERVNRNCALCHGIYGQGTPGRLSPRLAGLPKEYLVKATKEYVEGKRINPLMVEVAGLHHISDRDLHDWAAYMESLDLAIYPRFAIQHNMPGNPAVGERLFRDCRICHGRDGFGRDDKDAPPLALQHGEYLFQSIKMFQAKVRIHDDDPNDDTFDHFSDRDLFDLIAHIRVLGNQRVDRSARFEPPRLLPSRPAQVAAAPAPPAPQAGLQITDITQTVAQMELKPGVSIEDAISAMESKAIELNLRLVGEQRISQELEARGVETPYLSIFQFCNPMDAHVMVVANPIFSSYMPCRISLVEDPQGKMWLMMLNLDMLINSELLPPQVVDTAIRVNQQMLEVMVAGASGEF